MVTYSKGEDAAERVRLAGMLKLQRMGHEYRLAMMGGDMNADKIPSGLIADIFPTRDLTQEFGTFLGKATDLNTQEQFRKIMRKSPPVVPKVESGASLRSWQPDNNLNQLLIVQRDVRAAYEKASAAYVLAQSKRAAQPDEIEALVRCHAHIEQFATYLFLTQTPGGFTAVWQSYEARVQVLAMFEHMHTRVLELLKLQ